MADIIKNKRPVLAVSTRFAESTQAAAEIAAVCGFGGVDFAVTPENVAGLSRERDSILNRLSPSTEIRFHEYFPMAELGHPDSNVAGPSLDIYKRMVEAIHSAQGKNLTVHIGSNPALHGDVTFSAAVTNLSDLVDYAASRSVEICVENLRTGMTSSPDLFAELIEQSNASVTLDIGHALASRAGQSDGFPYGILRRLGAKIKNAHIYEFEDEIRGHLAPNGLTVIAPVLDALRGAGCEWWVLELANPKDIHLTNALLNGYFHDIAYEEDRISAILAP
jgi:sugar phosphate isomerase/epimerase